MDVTRSELIQLDKCFSCLADHAIRTTENNYVYDDSNGLSVSWGELLEAMTTIGKIAGCYQAVNPKEDLKLAEVTSITATRIQDHEKFTQE